MNTPIYSFIKNYAEEKSARFHMPGHKGCGSNLEAFDITEIDGADSLYEASGIIRESEKNAGLLFGAETFYSAEGSSLSIRAMLYLTALYAKENEKKCLIWAGRNAHKTFINAVSLLDIDVEWLCSENSSYLSCILSAEDILKQLDSTDILPSAIYLTSPDYLGNIADIKNIADVCHKKGILLLVDNAHGAYLKFLPESLHPIDLGADMCCDSAHKTLPALTGSAYLHISRNAPEIFAKKAKEALSLFGSTSPSYLILSSLDRVNQYLSDGYKEKLETFILKINNIKNELVSHGYTLFGNEPMKITIAPKSYGYSGLELAKHLTSQGIIPEFAEPDFLVLMPSPENSDSELLKLKNILLSLELKTPILSTFPKFRLPKRVISAREALFSQEETVPAEKAVGRILRSPNVGCPPAVPIAVSGEMIDENIKDALLYYGIKHCSVVKI